MITLGNIWVNAPSLGLKRDEDMRYWLTQNMGTLITACNYDKEEMRLLKVVFEKSPAKFVDAVYDKNVQSNEEWCRQFDTELVSVFDGSFKIKQGAINKGYSFNSAKYIGEPLLMRQLIDSKTEAELTIIYRPNNAKDWCVGTWVKYNNGIYLVINTDEDTMDLISIKDVKLTDSDVNEYKYFGSLKSANYGDWVYFIETKQNYIKFPRPKTYNPKVELDVKFGYRLLY